MHLKSVSEGMICWMFDKITEKEQPQQNKWNWKHRTKSNAQFVMHCHCECEGAFNFIYAMPFWFLPINYFAFVLRVCVSRSWCLFFPFFVEKYSQTLAQPLKTCQRKKSARQNQNPLQREFKNTSLLSLTLFCCCCCCCGCRCYFQLLCALSVYFGAWVFVWNVALLLFCCCDFFFNR